MRVAAMQLLPCASFGIMLGANLLMALAARDRWRTFRSITPGQTSNDASKMSFLVQKY